MALQKNLRRLRIKQGIRKKISGTASKPRLSVYRSNKDIYAQLIDDENGVTIASFSSVALTSGTKIDKSKETGSSLAKLALSKGIDSVVFDRNGYLYHGRVKSLAEGAREGGLKF